MKESKKIDKYLDLAWELKKNTVEYESDGDTNWSWCTRNTSNKLWKETAIIGDGRKNVDQPDQSIVKIS